MVHRLSVNLQCLLRYATIFHDEEVRLIAPDIEARFVSILERARATLRLLKMDEPYVVVATILGIGGRVLPLVNEHGEMTGKNTPETDKIEIKKEFSIENESHASLDCLMPLFDALWESTHSKRPSHYNLLAMRSSEIFVT